MRTFSIAAHARNERTADSLNARCAAFNFGDADIGTGIEALRKFIMVGSSIKFSYMTKKAGLVRLGFTGGSRFDHIF